MPKKVRYCGKSGCSQECKDEIGSGVSGCYDVAHSGPIADASALIESDLVWNWDGLKRLGTWSVDEQRVMYPMAGAFEGFRATLPNGDCVVLKERENINDPYSPRIVETWEMQPKVAMTGALEAQIKALVLSCVQPVTYAFGELVDDDPTDGKKKLMLLGSNGVNTCVLIPDSTELPDADTTCTLTVVDGVVSLICSDGEVTTGTVQTFDENLAANADGSFIFTDDDGSEVLIPAPLGPEQICEAVVSELSENRAKATELAKILNDALGPIGPVCTEDVTPETAIDEKLFFGVDGIQKLQYYDAADNCLKPSEIWDCMCIHLDDGRKLVSDGVGWSEKPTPKQALIDVIDALSDPDCAELRDQLCLLVAAKSSGVTNVVK